LYYNTTTSEICRSSNVGPSNQNILATGSNNVNSLSLLSGVGGNVTTYGNVISCILSGISYTHSQPVGCYSTLDTANGRFIIQKSGRYKISLSTSIRSITATGNLMFNVFINGNQYINPPTNTLYWATFTNMSLFSNANALATNQFSMEYYTATLNVSDYIDIRARQVVSSTVTSYLLANGTTITLSYFEP
jgi:hypothetical protein